MHITHLRTYARSPLDRRQPQAIEAFQGDPPTTVFLLSMRSGSVGINLTAANYVFIMEPALNPALEVRCALLDCAVLRWLHVTHPRGRCYAASPFFAAAVPGGRALALPPSRPPCRTRPWGAAGAWGSSAR